MVHTDLAIVVVVSVLGGRGLSCCVRGVYYVCGALQRSTATCRYQLCANEAT